MKFAKVHGLGNDFILLDLRGSPGAAAPDAERAAGLCDRHRGVGADGVLTLLPGDRMVIHNADGSVPEMCGNGARCAALWMATDGCAHPATGRVVLQTEAGARPCMVEAVSPEHGLVEVEMGVPEVEPLRALPLGRRRVQATPVSLGNPHRVLFLDESAPDRLMSLAREFGPVLCRAEDANIEFAGRTGPQRYAVAVFERGAGLTQACGTGACAVAAAAFARGDADPGRELTIDLPGGALSIRLDPGSRQLRMRGPAQLVYVGELAI